MSANILQTTIRFREALKKGIFFLVTSMSGHPATVQSTAHDLSV